MVPEPCAALSRPRHLAVVTDRPKTDLEQIAETVEQTWPRCDGETPSSAEHWDRAGFDDAAVVDWLEAGVPWALSADALATAGIEPRDVRREHAPGITLGLAYSLAEVSLAEVQRLVLGEEVPHVA